MRIGRKPHAMLIAVALVATGAAAGEALGSPPPIPLPSDQIGVERRATVVDVDGAVAAKGSATSDFSLRLEDVAECPGDSANDQWRVQGFFIPVGHDVDAVMYGAAGPTSEGDWTLYGADAAKSSYSNVLTAQNAAAGQPGRIDPIPIFSFGVLPAGAVTESEYHVGVACTYFGQTANWWSATLRIHDVDGASFRWEVIGVDGVGPVEVASSPSGTDSAWPVVVGLGAVCLLVGVIAFSRRRRARLLHTNTRSLIKEF